jgi:hypothetical protein
VELMAVPVEVTGGVVATDEAKLGGAVGLLLAATPAGFTGVPTLPGVAVVVDWNGLLFHGMLH